MQQNHATTRRCPHLIEKEARHIVQRHLVVVREARRAVQRSRDAEAEAWAAHEAADALLEGPHKLRLLGARLRQRLAVDESEEEPPPVLAEDAQEAPPPAIDAQLVGRTMWVFCPEPEDATDLTTYPGGWWDGKITEYYTPEEAPQTATDLGLQDPDFNVQFHFYDGVDEWQLYLRLDLDKYDPWVDEPSEPAEWAWSLEEE